MSDDERTFDDESLWDLGLSQAFRAADSDPLDRCGRFALAEEIARGGIGTIHRAWDDRLERDVAIKRLRDEHVEDTAMIGRFLAEARVAARLQHPGVVPVYDSGIDDSNRPYLCMKLVEGRTMVELLRDEPRDLPRLLDVFRQLCQTIAYAHDRGVVHRDLKPSNVMIGAFGEVLVVDWGFAKLLFENETDLESSDPEIKVRTEGSSSVAGSILGTPAYMPPEQARGETDDLDERVDVFALGAILCEILTGAPPYARESGKLALENAARGDLESALTRLETSGADADLTAMCRSCLNTAAAARPRDAGVLNARVEEYFAATQSSRERALIEAAEADVRAAEEHKLRRVTTILATAVIALILAGGAFGWREANRRRDTRISAAREFHAAMRDFEARMVKEDWSAAEQSINLAIVHAKQGRDHDGAARVRDARRRLAEARSIAAEHTLRRERAAAFVAVLDEVEAKGTEAPPARDRTLTTAFREAGLDVDRMIPSDSAREIRDMGLNVDELILLLDEWAAIRKIAASPGGQPDRSRRLSQLAGALDQDVDRAALRRAAWTASPAEMRELVSELEIGERTPHTLAMLAMVLVGQQQGELAVALLEDAHRGHPGDFWINHHLSVMLGARHEFGDAGGFADTDLERALHHAWLAVAADPESVFAREQVARLLIALERTQEAHRFLANAETLDPARVALMRRRLLRDAPLGTALELRRLRLKSAPEDVLTRAELAALLAAVGRWEHAMGEARACLDAEFARPSVVRTLVTSLTELGRYEEALEQARTHGLPENDRLCVEARLFRDIRPGTRPRGRREEVLLGRWHAHAGRDATAARLFARIIRTAPPGGPPEGRPRRRDGEPAGPGPGFGPPERRSGPMAPDRGGLVRRTMAATLLRAALVADESAEEFAACGIECLERELRARRPAHEAPRRLEYWLLDARIPASTTLSGRISEELRDRLSAARQRMREAVRN